MEPIIFMEDIKKYYGTVLALRGVDFSINPEEIVGLVGSNGAGKTTLVKILAGVIPPTQGKIYYKGNEVKINSITEAREKLNLEIVYQEQALIPDQTVAHNVFSGRELKYNIGPFSFLDEERMIEETERLMRTLKLDVSPNQEARFCSGGERQGIAISRALYFDADVIILDEPTTALSPEGVEQVIDSVEKAKEEGASSVIIRHNLEHLFRVVDRFVVFNNGKKTLEAKKEDVTKEELTEAMVRSYED